MRLLIHACCAACAIHPVETALKDGYTPQALFYNPNIQPGTEYERRKDALHKYCGPANVELAEGEYAPLDYFVRTCRYEERDRRCEACWSLRMEETVKRAKELGAGAFTTTLLASPYQNHELIKSICQGLSSSSGLEFYYRDFREGFRPAHARAREMGIYCQNYCGCIFSLVEREMEKKEKRGKKRAANK